MFKIGNLNAFGNARRFDRIFFRFAVGFAKQPKGG
jgi:hypothetical protein